MSDLAEPMCMHGEGIKSLTVICVNTDKDVINLSVPNSDYMKLISSLNEGESKLVLDGCCVSFKSIGEELPSIETLCKFIDFIPSKSLLVNKPLTHHTYMSQPIKCAEYVKESDIFYIDETRHAIYITTLIPEWFTDTIDKEKLYKLESIIKAFSERAAKYSEVPNLQGSCADYPDEYCIYATDSKRDFMVYNTNYWQEYEIHYDLNDPLYRYWLEHKECEVSRELGASWFIYTNFYDIGDSSVYFKDCLERIGFNNLEKFFMVWLIEHTDEKKYTNNYPHEIIYNSIPEATRHLYGSTKEEIDCRTLSNYSDIKEGAEKMNLFQLRHDLFIVV